MNIEAQQLIFVGILLTLAIIIGLLWLYIRNKVVLKILERIGKSIGRALGT